MYKLVHVCVSILFLVNGLVHVRIVGGRKAISKVYRCNIYFTNVYNTGQALAKNDEELYAAA